MFAKGAQHVCSGPQALSIIVAGWAEWFYSGPSLVRRASLRKGVWPTCLLVQRDENCMGFECLGYLMPAGFM